MNIVCATDQLSLSSEAPKRRTQIALSMGSALKGIQCWKTLCSLGLAAAAAFAICGIPQFSFGEPSSATKPEAAQNSQSTNNKPPQPALVWAQLPTTLKFSHATHVDLVACSECHVLKHKNPYPAMDKCNDCHDEVKAKEGSKECLMCHTSNDDYTAVYPKDGRDPDPCKPGFWGVNAKLPGLIRQNFDHVRHFEHQRALLETALREGQDAAKRASLEKELKEFPESECILCHPQIKKSKRASDDNFPKRSDCGRCHEVYGPRYDANDGKSMGTQFALESARHCAVCHKGARPDWDIWNGRWVYPDGTPIKCASTK
jgi:hypothetical protein